VLEDVQFTRAPFGGEGYDLFSERLVCISFSVNAAALGTVGTAGDGNYRFCANAEFDVCNWLAETACFDNYCLTCRHNRTIPDVN
jgi:hypothetical protein